MNQEYNAMALDRKGASRKKPGCVFSNEILLVIFKYVDLMDSEVKTKSVIEDTFKRLGQRHVKIPLGHEVILNPAERSEVPRTLCSIAHCSKRFQPLAESILYASFVEVDPPTAFLRAVPEADAYERHQCRILTFLDSVMNSQRRASHVRSIELVLTDLVRPKSDPGAEAFADKNHAKIRLAAESLYGKHVNWSRRVRHGGQQATRSLFLLFLPNLRHITLTDFSNDSARARSLVAFENVFGAIMDHANSSSIPAQALQNLRSINVEVARVPVIMGPRPPFEPRLAKGLRWTSFPELKNVDELQLSRGWPRSAVTLPQNRHTKKLSLSSFWDDEPTDFHYLLQKFEVLTSLRVLWSEPRAESICQCPKVVGGVPGRRGFFPDEFRVAIDHLSETLETLVVFEAVRATEGFICMASLAKFRKLKVLAVAPYMLNHLHPRFCFEPRSFFDAPLRQVLPPSLEHFIVLVSLMSEFDDLNKFVREKTSDSALVSITLGHHPGHGFGFRAKKTSPIEQIKILTGTCLKAGVELWICNRPNFMYALGTDNFPLRTESEMLKREA